MFLHIINDGLTPPPSRTKNFDMVVGSSFFVHILFQLFFSKKRQKKKENMTDVPFFFFCQIQHKNRTFAEGEFFFNFLKERKKKNKKFLNFQPKLCQCQIYNILDISVKFRVAFFLSQSWVELAHL